MNFAIIGSVILGLLSIFYYFDVALYVKTFGGFSFIWFILGICLIILAISIKCGWIQEIFKYKKISIIVISIFAVGFIFFAIVEGIIIYNSNMTPKTDAEYLVVLGAKVDEFGVTPPLKERLITASEYIEKHPDIKVVVSGGKGLNEPVSEASAMRDYLVEHGANSDNIILEDKSTNTKENMKFTAELIGSDKNIIVVSNGFHMFRATKLAESQGFSNIEGLAAKSDRKLLINYYVREVFGVVKDYAVGNIER